MRERSVLAAALLAAAIGACGPVDGIDGVDDTRAQSIIGGTHSTAADYPAVGVMLTTGVDGILGPVATMFCTATLIAPDVLLTAAHCAEVESLVYIGGGRNVVNYFSLALDVRDVDQTMTMPADATEIVQMTKHPEWDIAALDTFTGGLADLKDIAIAILARPLTGVAPAMVLESDDQSGVSVAASVEIVGYGQRTTDDQASVGLKEHATSEIRQVGSSEMQIGSVPSQLPQKCHGDSGGPTFLRVDDGLAPVLRIVGVTSHAYDDTDCDKGGVDTMVYPYRAWLDQALTAACTSQVRTACAGGGGLPLPGLAPADAGLPVDAADPVDSSVSLDRGAMDRAWSPPRVDGGSDVKAHSGRPASADPGCQCRCATPQTGTGVAIALLTGGLFGWRRRER